MNNSKETIENQTHDLPACGAVAQPTAPPRALILHECKRNYLSCLRSNAGRTLPIFSAVVFHDIQYITITMAEGVELVPT